MWFELRAVDLDFLAQAGRTWIVECEVRAPRADVWRAYADPATWSEWFPGVVSASYADSPRPYGVGTRREATVSGQRYHEVMVAWEEQRRWAYYIERATLPISRAHLECTEFEDCPGGTLVRWILAADPRLLLRLASPFFGPYLQRLFARAMRNLELYLAKRR